MQPDNPMNSPSNNARRKAMVVDVDRDRYRRKERTGNIQAAGFKVFPVLRMQDACARCKPGAFDAIVVNAPENAHLAVELCDQIKKNDPDQKVFLVAEGNPDIPSRDYRVSNWDELMIRLQAIGSGGNKETVLAA